MKSTTARHVIRTATLTNESMADVLRSVAAGWETAWHEGECSAAIDLWDVCAVLMEIAKRLDPDGE